jgi:hypothetical protein
MNLKYALVLSEPRKGGSLTAHEFWEDAILRTL